MTNEEYRANVEAFLSHPFIQTIQDTPKWTISDKDKRPLDIRAMVELGKTFGVRYTDERSLYPLPTVDYLAPNVTNFAFYVEAEEDNFVVLDIEPTCSEELKEQLLKLPYIYGETSMSGKGYHLVFPFPRDILEKYPEALPKKVLKDASLGYEILLEHWCTFTRNMLSDARESSTNDFLKLFEEQCQKQKYSSKKDIFVSVTPPTNLTKIPYYEDIMKTLQECLIKWDNHVEDHNNDHSNFEFKCAVHAHKNLMEILKIQSVVDTKFDYTDEIKTWLVYQAIIKYIPYREKHDEQRQKLPFLLYIAKEAIAKYDPNYKKKKAGEKK